MPLEDLRLHLSDRTQRMLPPAPKIVQEISLPSSKKNPRVLRSPRRPCWSYLFFTWASSCCYISSAKSSRPRAPLVMLERKTSEEILELRKNEEVYLPKQAGRLSAAVTACWRRWNWGTYHHNSGTVWALSNKLLVDHHRKFLEASSLLPGFSQGVRLMIEEETLAVQWRQEHS